MPSFTTGSQDLRISGPLVEVNIAVGSPVEVALKASNTPMPSPVKAIAMFDTGATGTVIQEGIADQLGLNPIGVTSINTPASTNVSCYQYAIRLIFPNNIVAEGIVIEAPLQGQSIQCLIGRDILAHGVLVYIGYMNQFTFSM